MNKKINTYILGGSGMLGWTVTRVLSQNTHLHIYVSVRSVSHKNHLKKLLPKNVSFFLFNAERDAQKLSRIIKKNSVIVNCIGIIKPYIQDTDSKSVMRALTVNALFPHELARVAQKKSARVLQIATDCVYSGQGGSYKEADPHDALDVYGKTKSLGEVHEKHFNNIRVSIIGHELFNKLSLLEWFLGQKKGAVVNGFTNHYWNGIPTHHFAKIVEAIIVKNISLPPLIHIMPANTVSKYELVSLFKKYFRPDIIVNKTKAKSGVNRILATEFATINTKLWRMAGYKKIPTMEELIKELAHTS